MGFLCFIVSVKINFIQNFNISKYATLKNINNQSEFYNVSFRGADKSLPSDTVSFSKKDLFSCEEDEIIEKISEAVNNPDNLIGSGSEAAVYRISGEPYCVRILKNKKNKIKKPVSTKLTKKDKINHVVAKLPNGIRVMKYLEGYPPYLLSLYSYDKTQKEVDKMLDEMPVSSFQKFFRQICYAKKHDMFFDCVWSNVIVNPKTNTITAIDFYKKIENDYLAYSVLQECYDSLIYPNAPETHKNTCAAKLLLALFEEMKPGVLPCIDVIDADMYGFIERCDLIKSPAYSKLLKKILNDIEILKIKDLYNHNAESLYNNAKNELNGKIKVAQSIIKQTLLHSQTSTLQVISDKDF